MGYVYVLKADNACKIGITSRNVDLRKSQIQTGCSYKISEVWSSKDIDNYKEIEKILHSTFSDKRVCGEWFSESFDVICNKAKSVVAEYSRKEKHRKKVCEVAEKRFHTIAETSELSGLSVFYIRSGVKSGLIPHIRCGNKAMIDYPKFMQMLDGMGG